MAVLIDTSVLIGVERQASTLEDALGNEEGSISAITLSELLHGAHRAGSDDLRLRREAFVDRLLASIEAVPITEAIARVHARIWSGLERAGTPVPVHDLWIAATALSHGMAVATSNVRDFQRVPGLEVIPV